MKQGGLFRRLLPVSCLTILVAGCGPVSNPAAPQEPPPVTNAPAARSSAATFLDGATGKAAVDQGLAAQDKIRRISEERNKDLEEVTK